MFDDDEEDVIEYLIFDDAMNEGRKSSEDAFSFGGLITGLIIAAAFIWMFFSDGIGLF